MKVAQHPDNQQPVMASNTAVGDNSHIRSKSGRAGGGLTSQVGHFQAATMPDLFQNNEEILGKDQSGDGFKGKKPTIRQHKLDSQR